MVALTEYEEISNTVADFIKHNRANDHSDIFDTIHNRFYAAFVVKRSKIPREDSSWLQLFFQHNMMSVVSLHSVWVVDVQNRKVLVKWVNHCLIVMLLLLLVEHLFSKTFFSFESFRESLFR